MTHQPIHAISGPVTTVLTGLLDAYSSNRVTYSSVPEECQPPRLVVEFASGAEVRAFAAALHDLSGADATLTKLLGEIADEVTGFGATDIFVHPEVVQNLIYASAAQLMEVYEEICPGARLVRRSDQYRDHLVAIAAVALAGLAEDGKSGRVPVGQPWPNLSHRTQEQIRAAEQSHALDENHQRVGEA